jgi:hypothetical protein
MRQRKVVIGLLVLLESLTPLIKCNPVISKPGTYYTSPPKEDVWDVDSSSNKVALLIPLHTPKFGYGVALLKTVINFAVQADIHFVLSNMGDAHLFRALLNDSNVSLETGGRPNNTYIQVYDGNDSLLQKHPVFYKKWWIISRLVAGNDIPPPYEYLLVCDAEVEFVQQPVDILATAHSIHSRGMVFGHDTLHQLNHQIMFSSSVRFSEPERNILQKLTKKWTIFPWFNEIPVISTKVPLYTDTHTILLSLCTIPLSLYW